MMSKLACSSCTGICIDQAGSLCGSEAAYVGLVKKDESTTGSRNCTQRNHANVFIALALWKFGNSPLHGEIPVAIGEYCRERRRVGFALLIWMPMQD